MTDFNDLSYLTSLLQALYACKSFVINVYEYKDFSEKWMHWSLSHVFEDISQHADPYRDNFYQFINYYTTEYTALQNTIRERDPFLAFNNIITQLVAENNSAHLIVPQQEDSLPPPDTPETAWLLYNKYQNNSYLAQLLVSYFEYRHRYSCGHELAYDREAKYCLELSVPLRGLQGPVITLSELIKLSNSLELQGEVQCPECHLMVRRYREAHIVHTPELLVVCMKIFNDEGVRIDSYLRVKHINFTVNVCINLDTYKLMAIVAHVPNSGQADRPFGRFVSLCRYDIDIPKYTRLDGYHSSEVSRDQFNDLKHDYYILLFEKSHEPPRNIIHPPFPPLLPSQSVQPNQVAFVDRVFFTIDYAHQSKLTAFRTSEAQPNANMAPIFHSQLYDSRANDLTCYVFVNNILFMGDKSHVKEKNFFETVINIEATHLFISRIGSAQRMDCFYDESPMKNMWSFGTKSRWNLNHIYPNMSLNPGFSRAIGLRHSPQNTRGLRRSLVGQSTTGGCYEIAEPELSNRFGQSYAKDQAVVFALYVEQGARLIVVDNCGESTVRIGVDMDKYLNWNTTLLQEGCVMLCECILDLQFHSDNHRSFGSLQECTLFSDADNQTVRQIRYPVLFLERHVCPTVCWKLFVREIKATNGVFVHKRATLSIPENSAFAAIKDWDEGIEDIRVLMAGEALWRYGVYRQDWQYTPTAEQIEAANQVKTNRQRLAVLNTPGFKKPGIARMVSTDAVFRIQDRPMAQLVQAAQAEYAGHAGYAGQAGYSGQNVRGRGRGGSARGRGGYRGGARRARGRGGYSR